MLPVNYSMDMSNLLEALPSTTETSPTGNALFICYWNDKCTLHMEIINKVSEKTVKQIINILQTLNFIVRYIVFDHSLNIVGNESISTWCSGDFPNDSVWLRFFEKVIGRDFWSYWEPQDMHFAFCAEEIGPFMLNHIRETTKNVIMGDRKRFVVR